MQNFTALEKIMYEKAIQKKSLLYSMLVKGGCILMFGFSIYFACLAIKLENSSALNRASILFLGSFFLWALFTYQNIIHKLQNNKPKTN